GPFQVKTSGGTNCFRPFWFSPSWLLSLGSHGRTSSRRRWVSSSALWSATYTARKQVEGKGSMQVPMMDPGQAALILWAGKTLWDVLTSEQLNRLLDNIEKAQNLNPWQKKEYKAR